MNFRDFCKFLVKFAQICVFSPKFSRNFVGIAGMLNNFQKSRKKLQKFAKLHENFANFSYLSIYRGQLTPPSPQGRPACKTRPQGERPQAYAQSC